MLWVLGKQECDTYESERDWFLVHAVAIDPGDQDDGRAFFNPFLIRKEVPLEQARFFISRPRKHHRAYSTSTAADK